VDDAADTIDELGPAVRREPDAGALGMAYQVVIGADGSRRWTFVGQRCLGLNGVSAEEAMQNPMLLYEMILPEHREAFVAAESEAIAAGKPFDIEVAMRRADGEVRWHRIASMPRPLPDGSTAWDGLQIDVTERRRIAGELAEQRRRLEVAVEATGLGFWEWDPHGELVIWSERNKALFGLPADAEMTISRYMELLHPEDLPNVREVYENAVAHGGGDFSVEHRVELPDGETRWILTHGRVITDGDGAKLVVGTSLDVTGRKAAEERRALLMGELAHRAKNGIAVIMAIVQQSARSSQTVEDLESLLMARLQSMAIAQDLVTGSGGRPVPLGEVVKQTLSPFGLARIEMSDEFEDVFVIGDIAVGLGLLLHEMATNAVKYGALSNRTGKVKIVRADTQPGMIVMHWCESEGPEVKPGPRKGFGTRVLESAMRTQGGKVDFAFEPRGFEARVEFPSADPNNPLGRTRRPETP
jgi:PAS domain S-box-containing protein